MAALLAIALLWLCASPALAEEGLPAPDDPAYHELLGDHHLQWPLHLLDAPAAWTVHPGRYFTAEDRPQDAAIVALIDTGVDPEHPDFINLGGASAEAAAGGQLLLSSARTFLSAEPVPDPYDVTDEHVVRIARSLGKSTLSSVQGSRRGNNKLLLHQFLLSRGLPTLDTEIAADAADVPRCMNAMRRRGYRAAVIKAQVGASGIGMMRALNIRLPTYSSSAGSC